MPTPSRRFSLLSERATRMAKESGNHELYGRLRAYQSEKRDEFIQLDFGPEDGGGRVREPRRPLPTGDQGSARRYNARNGFDLPDPYRSLRPQPNSRGHLAGVRKLRRPPAAGEDASPCGPASVDGPAKPALCAHIGARPAHPDPLTGNAVAGPNLTRLTTRLCTRRSRWAVEELHQRQITGSLAMYDRMIFKGHLTALFKQDGARCYLWSQGVALKDFTPYAKATTAQIADHCRALATSAGRPVISFDHVKTRNRTQPKDDLAKSLAERDGVSEGIVCLISAVEPCYSFQVRKRMATDRLEIFRRERACLHHYLYLIDPEFGFMHIRIQGWLPYEVQIYINGRGGWPGPRQGRCRLRPLRELARGHRRLGGRLPPVRSLRASGLAPPAQRLRQDGEPAHGKDQRRRLRGLLLGARPGRDCHRRHVQDPTRTPQIWPDLVRHAALNLSSEDVLGFLGRKLHPSLAAQVVTDAKRRPQGWRVRHRMAGNWVKVYDKASVLRVETTINNPRVPVPEGQRDRRRPARAAVV